MIQLPEKYVERIVGAFGKEGENWFYNMNALIQKYENDFEIEELCYFKHSTNLLLQRIF